MLRGNGRLEGICVIEVDDLILATVPEREAEVEKYLRDRFEFGKWQKGEAEYAGRRIRQRPGKIVVDMEKYILEQVVPPRIEAARRKDLTSPLTPAEIHSYRSICQRIQWVAREARPDATGAASILNSKLPSPTVEDFCMANKVAKYLRSTATVAFTLWAHDLDTMTFVTVSDAGGPGTASRGGAQGAWLVLVADAEIRLNRRARVSMWAWRSQRLKRAVASTIAAETLALSGALAEATWMQMLFRDAVYGDVLVPEWASRLMPFTAVLRDDCKLGEVSTELSVVDAKSVYDVLSKNSAGSKADRRTAVEMAIVRESLSAVGSQLRWVPHGRMTADSMTKCDPTRGNMALLDLMKRSTMTLIDEEGHMNERSLNLALKSRTRAASLRELLKDTEEEEEAGAAPASDEGEQEQVGGLAQARGSKEQVVGVAQARGMEEEPQKVDVQSLSMFSSGELDTHKAWRVQEAGKVGSAVPNEPITVSYGVPDWVHAASWSPKVSVSSLSTSCVGSGGIGMRSQPSAAAHTDPWGFGSGPAIGEGVAFGSPSTNSGHPGGVGCGLPGYGNLLPRGFRHQGESPSWVKEEAHQEVLIHQS